MPAVRAGLESGDVIFAIDDVSITSVQDLVNYVQQTGGRTMTVRFLRGRTKNSRTLVPQEVIVSFDGN